jgi:hypothetical protein
MHDLSIKISDRLGYYWSELASTAKEFFERVWFVTQELWGGGKDLVKDASSLLQCQLSVSMNSLFSFISSIIR